MDNKDHDKDFIDELFDVPVWTIWVLLAIFAVVAAVAVIGHFMG